MRSRPASLAARHGQNFRLQRARLTEKNAEMRAISVP
jgi:hypothetical protein